jgi:catechol 2,3-dioxygenase-like lactoylglutathione lyase family enzyme
LGEAHDRSHLDRGKGHRQKQALLRRRAGTARNKCLRAARTLLGYGYGRDSIALWVIQVERPVPADEKSGLHFCFAAPDTAAVDAFHSAAMASGGHDNGAPGLRPIYGPDYYAAFIIDPDGYRIEAYYGPAET